ncbi:MAG TPA: hypothetical protein VFL13_03895 [Candidatus Baltobacteraceae bacterium]|nr:hypothetical protein [Candidatus Baltobacteraceae bacterium]
MKTVIPFAAGIVVAVAIVYGMHATPISLPIGAVAGVAVAVLLTRMLKAQPS